MISVVTIELCHCSTKVGDRKMNDHECVPINLLKNKLRLDLAYSL